MKHLVMLGTGQAHVHLLSTLATQPLVGVQITLVTPYAHSFYPSMAPDFVAGHHALPDCVIPLEPFLRNPTTTWLQRSATALDANTRLITLDDGSTVPYDILSINGGAVLDKQKIEQTMPGAREHALFVYPLEPFATLWPRVVELGQKKPLRLAVIGADATAFELACAVAHRLPASSVTLLAGDAPLGASYPGTVQTMMTQALRDRRVTVIQQRVVGVTAGEVTLASGARLACDVPIIAPDAQGPAWLNDSDLTLACEGLVAGDATQRSTSHPQANTLKLLSCGNRRAIANWGKWSAQGRWVWWLKDWLDRGVIKKHTTN